MKTQTTGQLCFSSRGRKTGLTLWHRLISYSNCIVLYVSEAGHSTQCWTGLTLWLCACRAFEDVFVSWRATFSPTAPALLGQGVNLTQELQQTSGRVLCRRGQVLCVLHLEVRADQVRKQEEAG